MSSNSTKFDCQKFSPNIFNKSKCQHCFRSKDQHSSEALENNRASRKISKCGYLFVAPDWDFSIPMNRTKRWQRRWFVLYEDGELTYSVDEHPDTIPQAIIDMTKVFEVSDAEESTGNKFSIAIAASDKTHFVKGTCKEESRWWFDVLVIYPRNLNGRSKRNVALTCVKSTPNISQSAVKSSSGQEMRIGMPRPRFNSCHLERGGLQEDEPLRDSTSSALNTSKAIMDRSRDEPVAFSNKEQKENGNTDDGLDSDKNGGRSRRYQRRDGKKSHCHRSRSLGSSVTTTSTTFSQDAAAVVDGDGLGAGSGSAPSTSPSSYSMQPRVSSPLYVRLSDVPLTKRYDSLESLQLDQSGPLSPKSHSNVDDEVDSRTTVNDDTRQRRSKSKGAEDALHDGPSQLSSSSSSRSRRKISSCSSSTTSASCSSHDGSIVSQSVKEPVEEPWREHQVRGDPDGCGLDHLVLCPSAIPEIRVDPLDHSAEEYLNIKKGWLMKMEMAEEWKKRWCVLVGSSFAVYLDSTQEDIGLPSVVIHMDHVQHIEEVEVGRNYGLKIKLVDGNCHVFSAVTATFRSNWIYALKNAANARDVCANNSDVQKQPLPLQKDVGERIPFLVKSPITPLLAVDNDRRTVTGAPINDRSTRVSNAIKTDVTYNKQPAVSTSTARNLPPSPPLNRTAISKVKERARLKTNVRVSSRTPRTASSSKTSSGEFENSEAIFTETEDREVRKEGICGASAVKEIFRSPSSKSNVRLRDKSRRYTLPGRIGDSSASEHLPSESRLNSSRSSSRTPRLARDKTEMKWQGDIHCSSIHERDRVIEVLESRLMKSESKLLELRDEMERLLKSRDDTQLRLHAELSMKELENERLRLELLPIDDDDGSGCGVGVKIIGERSEDISRLKNALDRANGDLVDVVNKLQASVDENDILRKLLSVDKFVSAGDSLKRSIVSRVNSLSDLTNVGNDSDIGSLEKEAIVEKYTELRNRFEKAINEVKCLRRELKEAHGRCDGLDVELINQKRCAEAMNDDYRSQLSLMSARIEDLTSKLTYSEKQLRQQSKQKSGKQESREQRRTRSLKGREALTVSKEVENKVDELERKLHQVEVLLQVEHDALPTTLLGESHPKSVGPETIQMDSRSEHLFVRLNSLESKVSGAIQKAEIQQPSTYSSRVEEGKGADTPVTLISELNLQIEELKTRTNNLEMTLTRFRQKIEKCRDLMDSTAGRSDVDRQERLREVERHLTEALTWLDGSNIGLEASNLAAFFTRISSGMSEILKSRMTVIEDSQGSEGGGHGHGQRTRQMFVFKVNQETNLLNVVAHCLPSRHCDSVDYQRVIAEYSRALLDAAKMARSRLKMNSELGWIVGLKLSSGRLDSEGSDLNVGSLVRELKDVEGVIRILTNSCREKWRKRFSTSEKSANDRELRSLPTMSEMKMCFANAQRTLVQKLVEIDVVSIVSNLLRFSSSNFLPDISWLLRLLDRRTELVIDAIHREEEGFMKDVYSVECMKEASESRSSDRESGVQSGKAIISSEQEFANTIVQLTFLFICLPFLSSLLEKGEWPTRSRTFGFYSPPLPRVVGELVKPEFRFEIPAKTQMTERRSSIASENKTVSDDGCLQCKELQRKVQQMAEKYANDLLLETERHQTKLEVLYRKHTEAMNAMDADHQKRERGCCEEVQALQGKLSALEEDYELQLVSLKEMFEQELAKRTDIKINKANVQLKYRAEIDQLKNLCEKGLVAMEHSHRRVVAELEEKHRVEINRLCSEKEQVLAEETQATLAALDAMRKAHEAELQKEVANFKEEFLRKMGRSSAADLDAIHREHEDEINAIKREILLLSEKYSVKCLECAALEEHVDILTNQLTESNSLIFDLTARNKQLNSHLRQSIRDLSCLSKDANVNLLLSRDPITMKELKIHLKLKDSQLMEKDEEIAELNRKLAATKNQQNELENQCRLLDASEKADNRSCEEEMSTLKIHLENIIMNGGVNSDGMRRKVSGSAAIKQQIAQHLAEPKAKPKVITGSNVRARELMKSSSCPGLSVGGVTENQSSSSTTLLIHQLYSSNKTSGSPSAPMVGVVASRKKIFEHPEK